MLTDHLFTSFPPFSFVNHNHNSAFFLQCVSLNLAQSIPQLSLNEKGMEGMKEKGREG